ncbi:diguanylate cyclase [Tissierella carlieri]|uniref:sensor domain-containing diguanylate cyclase n=1 Tax=Tissierella carlieri TaxID=689904 RepID=UPI001C102AD0|nr:GGDEF domain-containing protein [Tissierella carlieri]MBU5312253.1 diguanylate cyclase [Tissierella carlieri]
MGQNSNIDFLKDEEKLKLIAAIEQAAVTIIMTDIDGNIQYCNPAFEQISGYSLKEVIGKNPRILKSGLTHSNVFEDMWNTITKGKDWKGDLINKKKDGTIYYEEARITPITDSNGKIVNFLGVKQDVSRRKYLEEKLKQTSIRDSLTNIYNRGYAFERLGQSIELFKKKEENFSLALVDIDFFKNINDTYGHQAGDFVLKEFAEILASSIRTYDVLARYGGEEFILILQGIGKSSSVKVIKRVSERIKESLFNYEDKKVEITFSCGIVDASEIGKETISLQNMIYEADRRLYEAKNTGRNKIIVD